MSTRPRIKRHAATTGLAAIGSSHSRRGADILVGDVHVGFLSHTKAHHLSSKDSETSEWHIWLHAKGTNRRLKATVPGDDYAVAKLWVLDNFSMIYKNFLALNPPTPV